MTKKPILFSAEMIRAILEGRKTQTRRVVKGVALEALAPGTFTPEYVSLPENSYCPFGQSGDRLWVREAFWLRNHGNSFHGIGVDYKAGGDSLHLTDRAAQIPRLCCWHPSIHMPRWASRITLEIKQVRVERIQDISHKDALAEGVSYDVSKSEGSPLSRFRELWDSINAKPKYVKGAGLGGSTARFESNSSWQENPFVWVISFERME